VRAHAINLQLDAVIKLALTCGLRRGEIFGCRVDDVHPDNAYVIVPRRDGTVRGLNLWSVDKLGQPMSSDAFEKLLRTYIGRGWSFRRLRDTCAVEWLRAGLAIWDLQELLGHRTMKDTLPYMEAARGDVVRNGRWPRSTWLAVGADDRDYPARLEIHDSGCRLVVRHPKSGRGVALSSSDSVDHRRREKACAGERSSSSDLCTRLSWRQRACRVPRARQPTPATGEPGATVKMLWIAA